MATCQCLCRAYHPATCTAPRCPNEAEPGFELVKTAPGVGSVAILMCPTCRQHVHVATQRNDRSAS